MDIIGHRGSGGTHLENTWDAIEAGWQSGADGIEIDVRLSADDQIVVYHDKSTKRLSRHRLKIKHTSWSALSDVLLVDSQSGKHHIPLLQEIFHRAPRDKSLFLEIKSGPKIIQPLLKIIPEWMLKKLTIISFRTDIVTAVKSELPAVRCLLLLEKRLIRDYSLNVITQAQQLKADGLGLDHTGLSQPLAKAIKDAGLYLNVWTVNNMDDIDRFQSMGVDALSTDYPKAFTEIRDTAI